jgi:predicted membrane protein
MKTGNITTILCSLGTIALIIGKLFFGLDITWPYVFSFVWAFLWFWLSVLFGIVVLSYELDNAFNRKLTQLINLEKLIKEKNNEADSANC